MSGDLEAAIAAEQQEVASTEPPPAPAPRSRRRQAGLVQPETAAVAPAGPTVHERTASATFQMLLIEEIAESPTNPRRNFDANALAELAADIAKHGVLEPILVRPRPEPVPEFLRYEIVFGARRFRAAERARLRDIPARIVELTDLEVVELQLAENLQRQDLHELEEAEAFDQLHRQHGLSIKEIVDRYAVGKSESYVYARMKLCALSAEAKKAFHAGDLDASTALLIARIPVPELQKEALKSITAQAYRGGDGNIRRAMTYREAADYVQRSFMLRLADAPFATDDAELVPAAGPCTKCPKRTGNQRELFGDVKGADVCTDPKCFESKREALWARTTAEATARGTKVLDDTTARKVFPYGHGQVGDRAPYVDLKDANWEDPNGRTWGKLLGKSADEHVVLARDPAGDLHRLVPKDRVPELLKAAGHKPAARVAASDRESKRYAEKAKAERAKTILENRIRAMAVNEIAGKVKAPLRAEDLQLIAEMFFGEMHHESRKALFDCLGLDIRKGSSGGYDLLTPFRKHLVGLDASKLVVLLVVMSVSPRDYWANRKDPLADVAKRYKVDLGEIRKELVAQAKDIKAAKAPKKARR